MKLVRSKLRTEVPMEKEKSKAGRRRVMYAYDGTLDPWVPATREFLDTMMPETLSKRAASTMLIAAGLGNEKIVELTGMCIRSVRALRKPMQEQEATSSIFAIRPGSGRKSKKSLLIKKLPQVREQGLPVSLYGSRSLVAG